MFFNFFTNNIKNSFGETISHLLFIYELPISNEWYDDDMKDKQKNPDFIE